MTKQRLNSTGASPRPRGPASARLQRLTKYLPTSGVGLLLAASFFAASLTPSLMPRNAIVQGLLAGTLASIGYAIGQTLVWLWHFLELPKTSIAWRNGFDRVSYVVALLLLLGSTWKAADWQNSTRAAVGMEPVSTAQPLIIIGVAALAFLLMWLIALAFLLVLHSFRQQLDRFVPRRISAMLAFLCALWIFWALGEGVLVKKIFQLADSTLEAADSLIEPDIPQPTDPMRTGSSSSAVAWEDLGRWGRDFIHRQPSREEIAEFVGDEAMDPVRVYVGLGGAPNPQERAELALQELIRLGGFERSAIVVMVPVGTGWMDPGSHDVLEFILGGDVATVAVQYSYLKAALSVLADSEVGFEQARALFNAVYAHWSKLPKESRPKFYVHGLSQGAQISQNTLPLLDILQDPIDGVLWAGSPFFAQFWKHVRERREPQSPVWQPRYGNGSLVRVANQHTGLEQFSAPWGPTRIIFLNYASDPIVYFTYDLAYRKPEWLNEPRAFDVSPDLRWYPIVTMLQVGLDTTISLDAPGYGHYYVAEDYIDAWAELLQPPDWTTERSSELKEIFIRRGPSF